MWRLIACLLVFGAIGCGQQVAPAVLAAAPGAPAIKAAAIRPVSHQEEATSPTSPQEGMVTYEVQIAEFPALKVATLGLTDFFASAAPANGLMREAVTNSALMQLARAHTNVIVQLPSDMLAAGTCTEEAAQNLVNTLRAMPSVDLIAAPKRRAEMNRECDINVQDSQPVVIGTPGADGQVQTANLAFGVATRLQAAKEGDRMHLVVQSSIALFHGYKTPAQTVPAPIFELRAMALRTDIKPGEVLVLGSPVLEKRETSVERVPYLSAIPLLGKKFFAKRQVQTNSVRNLMFIRVKE